MKTANELSLIVLISIGVMCGIYWIKSIPNAAPEDVLKKPGCQMAAWSIGTPGTEEEKAARNRAANDACKGYFNTADTTR